MRCYGILQVAETFQHCHYFQVNSGPQNMVKMYRQTYDSYKTDQLFTTLCPASLWSSVIPTSRLILTIRCMQRPKSRASWWRLAKGQTLKAYAGLVRLYFVHFLFWTGEGCIISVFMDVCYSCSSILTLLRTLCFGYIYRSAFEWRDRILMGKPQQHGLCISK